MRGPVLLAACSFLWPFTKQIAAQTSYSMISGMAVDAASATPIAGARIECFNISTGAIEPSNSDSAGRFTLPLLSPGLYRVTASASLYQDRMVDLLDLAVAAHLDLRFEMWKLSDPWHTGSRRTVVMPKSHAVSPFYGPDINVARSDSFAPPPASATLLDAARSYVVDRALIAELPLAGRDTYATLAVEPGVTSGTTTARGLGMSVNGQRPTSTQFLLDGLENNNYLTTGPLVALAPEAVQEYRFSTANFSAPYGGAAGLVANAVSLAGGAAWHGIAYLYLRNQALTAADPQRKAECAGQPLSLCVPRPPLHEVESGLRVSGPLRRKRLFASAWLDVFRYRSAGSAELLRLPASPLLGRVAAAPASDAARWLVASGLPILASAEDTASVPLAPPVLLNHINWLGRLDYSAGAHRLFARAAHARSDQPGFFWSPYPAYAMPLVQSSLLAAAGDTWLPRPSFGNEARLAIGAATLRLERTPGVPQLESEDQTVLPGSPSSYSLRHRGRHAEVLDNATWIFGSHILRAGASVLERWIRGSLNFAGDGYYLFQTAQDFANLNPLLYRSSVDRIASQTRDFRPVQPDRTYRYAQAAGFLQDTIRLSERFTLNAGFRLENFGGVRNIGRVPDTVVSLGPGETLERRIAHSDLTPSREAAYPATWNPAVRIGLAWAGRFGVALRAGYGIYYDRPFENLWITVSNNAAALAFLNLRQQTNPRATLATPVLNGNPDVQISLQLPRVTWLAPDLKAPRIQSVLLSATRSIGDVWAVEITATASAGRRLITSNIVNRRYTTDDFDSVGRSQPTLPDIVYRANQGGSQHAEIAAVARYQAGSAYLQAAYTLSHTFDNQSDAVSGDFDFGFTGLNPVPTAPAATFTAQFDSRPDRARSDFDQRHNLVFLGTWTLPNPAATGIRVLARGWRLSGLLALRSGLPFSVYGSSGSTTLRNNRANLNDPSHFAIHREAATGGIQLLNPAAFGNSPNLLGNSGRNAFRSPRVFSADLSLSRTISLSQRLRLTLRADAFNFLNHPNLGQPDNYLGSPTFGVAPYGRRETSNGFPGQIPFVESPRTVQMMLRVEF